MSNTLPVDQSTSHANLVEWLAIQTDASTRLTNLENELLEEYITLVDQRRGEYTGLQDAISKAEKAIEEIALRNPQWFEKVKTVSTPYGTVKSRTTTKLEVANEEVSIALLQQLGEDAAPFLRVKTELNLEALEILPDIELERVRIKRVTTEKITSAPAKVNLGSAVKAADAIAKKQAAKKAAASA